MRKKVYRVYQLQTDATLNEDTFSIPEETWCDGDGYRVEDAFDDYDTLEEAEEAVMENTEFYRLTILPIYILV